MISIEFYIAYVFVAVALILIPGPVVTLTVASSLVSGWKHGIVTACGVMVGTAMLLLLGSISKALVFAALSEWQTVLRSVGGASFLIFLGVKKFSRVRQNRQMLSTFQIQFM